MIGGKYSPIFERLKRLALVGFELFACLANDSS